MVEVWFFYILAAVAIFGFNAIVDKIILTRHLNSFSYLVTGIPSKLAYMVAIMLFVPIDSNCGHFYCSCSKHFLGSRTGYFQNQLKFIRILAIQCSLFDGNPIYDNSLAWSSTFSQKSCQRIQK